METKRKIHRCKGRSRILHLLKSRQFVLGNHLFPTLQNCLLQQFANLDTFQFLDQHNFHSRKSWLQDHWHESLFATRMRFEKSLHKVTLEKSGFLKFSYAVSLNERCVTCQFVSKNLKTEFRSVDSNPSANVLNFTPIQSLQVASRICRRQPD